MRVATFASALALGFLIAAPAFAQGTVEKGSKPQYSFRSAPVNSMGVQSLADLKGRPTLVEFWGTH